MECIDDNVASEFVSGGLPKTAITKVENHLAKCRDCRDLVAALAMSSNDVDSQVETRPHDKLAYSSDAAGGKAPMRAWAVGDRVGRYLVLSALGAGGMGVVFSAYDPQLDRKVALKLLRSQNSINSKEARARLRREAQAIAQLSHPNVVNVYDVGATDDGDVYIAMEFVEGDTLTHWLRKFSRTPREIIDVFLQAARGLFAAHSVGLLHRDFKPDNVLVGGDGRVRVTDFGLARSVLGPDEAPKPNVETTHLHVELTATGTVLGTPRYMPPEQLLGPNIDARSDQFSFCVALYEALYGQHPLPGSTAVCMLESDTRALPAPEKKGISSTIGRAVSRGLEKDRAKRFASMAALITELAPRVERSPFRFAAVGLGSIIIAGAAAAAVYASRETPEAKEGPMNKTIDVLLDKLNEIERQRRELALKVAEYAKRDTSTKNEIENLRDQLEKKNDEIEELVDKISLVKANDISKVTKSKVAKPTQVDLDKLVLDQFASAEFAACFNEWAERNHDKKAIDVTVRLTVGPQGHGHDAEANDADPVGPSLAFCIQSASTRVRYPSSTEELEISAIVRFTAAVYRDGVKVADKKIGVIPTIVARRPAVASQSIDLNQ